MATTAVDVKFRHQVLRERMGLVEVHQKRITYVAGNKDDISGGVK